MRHHRHRRCNHNASVLTSVFQFSRSYINTNLIHSSLRSMLTPNQQQCQKLPKGCTTYAMLFGVGLARETPFYFGELEQ